MAVTAAEFKAEYPEFDGVSDDLISRRLASAVFSVGEDWDDVDTATFALAAHNLASEGYPAKADASYSVTTGAVQRKKVGEVEVTYGGNAAASGGGASGSDYAATAYGRTYLMILKRNVGGPRLSIA